MALAPSVDDLRLVAAIQRTRSIGAAARALQISQPSASQRLARLERSLGTPLFVRDTRGARPTAAGVEFCRQAGQILDHLDSVFEASRLAEATHLPRVGTFSSLAEVVFPVIHDVLAVDELVDHGYRLLDWLAEGTIDAAIVAITEQVDVPAGLRIHRLGSDDLALLVPPGAEPPVAGRRSLQGRQVVFSTYDNAVDTIRAALIRRGARPHRTATVPTALAIARSRDRLALVPRSALRDIGPGERLLPGSVRHRLRLNLVLPREPAPGLLELLPVLRAGLRLDQPAPGRRGPGPATR